MHKKRIVPGFTAFVLVIVMMFTTAGCGIEKDSTNQQTNNQSNDQMNDQIYNQTDGQINEQTNEQISEQSERTEFSSNPASADEIISSMSIREKIGQVILIDFRKWLTEDIKQSVTEPVGVSELNPEIAQIISDYHLGNIILFAENCETTENLVKLTYELQQAAIGSGHLPLLIGVDQEGGMVCRLKTGTCMSGSMAVGFSGDSANAELTGKVIGSELSAVRINCTFAPDADVNVNPNNPIIGVRSFSDDPRVVADMASAMAKGLSEQGIIACAKHFPGHGDTDTDSHTGLPLVDCSYAEWKEVHALPFERLISEKIPMIMTAHIQYPGLDDTRFISRKSGEEIYLPATLSKKIITDILKGELGFDGVVSTDALDMDAIADNFGQGEAAVMALNAGADLLCMPVTLRSMEDASQIEALYTYIEEAVADGTLSLDRLNDAVESVVDLKLEQGILEADYDIDLDAVVRKALEIVGGSENRAIERRVAHDSVKLEYEGTYEAFAPSESENVTILMHDASELYSARYAIDRLNREGRTINADILEYSKLEELSDEIKDSISRADYLIVGSEQTAATMKDEAHWANRIPLKIFEFAEEKGIQKLAVICSGLPYQAEKLRDRYPCFLIASVSGMAEEDLNAERFSSKFGPAIPAAFEHIFK